MRRNVTIRQVLLPILFMAAGIPITLFAIVSQKRVSASLNESIESQIGDNLNHTNDMMNLVLEKYDDVMNELCTDNETVRILKDINDGKDTLNVRKDAIENELCRLCNREEYIKGITIITNKKQVIYYDELEDSSRYTLWADENKFYQKEKGTYYRGVKEPLGTGDNQIYIFQISKHFENEEDPDEAVGTVIFSINVKALNPALKTEKKAKTSILENGVIIADVDQSKIGTVPDYENLDNYRFAKKTNSRSGLTILSMHSLDRYNDMRRSQLTFWLYLSVISFIFLTALGYRLTKPYLDQINVLANAMSEVEKGDFHVKVPELQTNAVELKKIYIGFNQMVQQIDALIEQVKNAVVEQKNAELSALEAQIDPHFLYNTLDTINWKAIEQEQYEISDMLGALADILRYTVRNAGAETTIAEEIDWMKKYMVLQKGKFDIEPQIQIRIPEELYECKIHKLLLQPFIENAMKHGFCGRNDDLKLTLIMKNMGEQIHITIQDNGNGIEAEELKRLNNKEAEEYLGQGGEHLGVINVRKRLMLYYGDKAELYFESQAGSYTKVHLFIPARGE